MRGNSPFPRRLGGGIALGRSRDVIIKYKVRSIVRHDGDIILGKSVSNPLNEVSASHEDFLRHCIIVGSTGSGKTTTAAFIASQLRRYGGVVILDWYGEFPRVLEGFGCAFELCRASPERQIPLIDNPRELVTLLEETLGLTPPQVYILQRALRRGERFTTPAQIMRLVELTDPPARWMVESKYALLRKLDLLFSGTPSGVFGSNYDYLMKYVDGGEGLLVIDLSVFPAGSVRRFVCLLLLKFIEMVRTQARGNVYVIVDEAHNVLSGEAQLLDRLFSEVRKRGVGLTIVTQSPSVISHRILTNANVKVIHTLKSREDVDIVSRAVGNVPEIQSILPRLDVGEALVDAPSIIKPAIVKIPPPKSS